MPYRSYLPMARILAGYTGQTITEEADIEAQQEREQELARAIQGQERGRRAQRQMGRGRLVGGLLSGIGGSLLLKLATGALAGPTGGLGLLALQGLTKGAPLIRALFAAGGGRKGAKIATKETAKKWESPIDVGKFQAARGRERETEFRAGEQAFRENLAAGIDAGAVSDFMSALAFQNLLPGLFGKVVPTEMNVWPGFAPEPSSLASLTDMDRRGLSAIIQSLA